MTDKKIIKISYYHGFADMRRYFSKEFFTNYTFEINNPDCIECDYWIVFGDLPVKNEITKVNSQNMHSTKSERTKWIITLLKRFQKMEFALPRLALKYRLILKYQTLRQHFKPIPFQRKNLIFKSLYLDPQMPHLAYSFDRFFSHNSVHHSSKIHLNLNTQLKTKLAMPTQRHLMTL